MILHLVGIIGGSGLYTLQSLTNIKEYSIQTPYGSPSGPIVTGYVKNTPVAFLPRHGIDHTISPSEIPAQANIYALKSLGVTRIISISAVGSLQLDIKPLDLVVPDQILDRTKIRSSTFFEKGIVAHVAFDQPFCPALSEALADTVEYLDLKVHRGGTYVVIEGPAFSTKAESLLYRSWGVSIIGMTALPEAKLAREAEICYSTLACATDYDCWLDNEESVTADTVLANVKKNVTNSKHILEQLLPKIPKITQACFCQSALHNSIVTPLEKVSPDTLLRLGPLVDRYL